MKSYKLEIKTIVFVVAVASIVIFSTVLFMLHLVETEKLGELLLHYGFLIAPITLLWVWLEKSLWHIPLLQSMRKSFNIPPDIRGRWEGVINSSSVKEPQKFVIEVSQSLTTLHVHAYSSIGKSKSILVEIAADDNENQFTLCFFWQGETPTNVSGKQIIQRFNGYTLLHLNDFDTPKKFKGTYFTDVQPEQTFGTIELSWVSLDLKHRLE